MTRELLFATVVSAAWLTLCFLAFGFLYAMLSGIVGPFRLMAWEGMFGHIDLGFGATVARGALWMYGVAMFAALAPVNYYWLGRLHRENSVDSDQ